jgi:hypothetical protein
MSLLSTALELPSTLMSFSLTKVVLNFIKVYEVKEKMYC